MKRRPSEALKSVARKLEFSDALVLLYIAVFVREYFWLLQNNKLAWSAAVVVSLALFALFLSVKDPGREAPPVVFWPIVGLPLLFVYGLRVAYPDLSFDVLNYHILHSERALRGLLNIPGDWVPAYFPFLNNPAPDMITGIFRHVLGFRLGTVINYVVLLWTGIILFRFLRMFLTNGVLISFAVLLILFSEELLFEINNYMVDLLAMPLLLEAAFLAISKNEDATRAASRFVLVLFLLGMSVALKLTNLVFAFPIGLVALQRLATARLAKLESIKAVIYASVAFLFPILPYASYVYWLTGNPTFPFFNKVFKSPLWPIENVFDGRWGPKGLTETLLWPFKIWLVPDRVSELNVYAGRISLGVAAAILLLILGRRDYRLRSLSLITLASAALWSLGTGYIRYGLFLEVLGGLALVSLAVVIWNSELRPTALRLATAALVFCVLVFQTLLGATYIPRTEWGGRSTIRRDYRDEVPLLLSDHSLSQFLSAEEAKPFEGVEAWVDCSYKTSAIAVMLRNNIPFVNIFVDAFFATPPAFKKYQAALRTVAQKKMVSIAFAEDTSMAHSILDQRGFLVLKSTPVEFPYYSHNRRLHLVVMEVALKPSSQPEGIFDAQIKLLQGLSTIKAGEMATIRVKVRNNSAGVWSALGQPEGSHQVKLGNKWLDPDGTILINDDGRTSLPRDIAPDQEVELELRVKGPPNPGNFVLMLDLVQENVAWFNEKGSATVDLPIVVER